MDSNTLIIGCIAGAAIVLFMRSPEYRNETNLKYQVTAETNGYRSRLNNLQRAADRGDMHARQQIRTEYGTDFGVGRFS